MDGTRTGRHLLKVEDVPQFYWGLPLTADTTALVRMMPPPFADPVELLSVKVDASAGISAPAPTSAELQLKGDLGAGTNSSLAAMSAEARHEALNRFWKDRLGQVEVTATSTSYDSAAEVLHVTMTGTLRMDWPQNEYRVDLADFPYGKVDFSRTPGLDADAPYVVNYPVYRRTVETITLPRTGNPFHIGTDMDLDESIGGFAMHRQAQLHDGVFTIDKSERSLVPEFPASEAKSAEARLHALAQRTPLLHMPLAYQSTAGDLAAAKADTPTTAGQYVNRAVIYMKKGLTTEALADLNRALELDPADAFALADRALLKIQLRDYAGVRADLARSEAIKPNFAMNFKARGELAMAENNVAVAVPAFEQALALEPDDAFLLSRLSFGEYRLTHYAKALDYCDRLAKLTPETPATRYLRMDILEKLGRDADLIALYTSQIEKAPNSIFLLRKRAAAYLRMGNKDLAAKDTAAADEAARRIPPVALPPVPVPARSNPVLPPPVFAVPGPN
jgi:tetratricopeptide (TPR) repeat protein